MGTLFRRLRYLLNRRQLDQELESDMEFHREMMAREGRRNFGNPLRLREQARDAWGWTWIERLGQDLRYALRTLMRSPGFTATAVLVLAIGIGVNVTAFSLFNMIALKPLPVRDPDSLVQLQRRSPEIFQSEMPYPSVIFYRDHARTLSAVMAVMGVPPMHLGNSAEPLRTNFASGNYFSELGTQAALGRLFDPASEDKPDAAPVAVLSYGAWQRRFGADPSVVGRTIRIDNKPATVIGILPLTFAGLGGQQHVDVWLPLAQQPYFIEGSKVLTDSSASSVRMWARLAPGVTAKMAEQELLALTNELRRQHPKEIWDNEYIHSEPGGHLQVIGPEMYQVDAEGGVLTLLILVVACANLGGLLLARGVTREHEMGIRMAIGASRKRIFRQLFTESLLLAFLGAIVGVALSYAVLRVALVWLDAPPWLSPVPDWRVLLFSIGAALGAAIFFGLTPALQIARQRQRKPIARQILVGAQVAASCVLLIVAGLLVRAMHHILYTSPGFGYEHVFSIDPQLGVHGYTPSAAQGYLDQMESRLRAMPGVTSVSLVKLPPMGHTVSRTDGEIDGRRVAIYPNWVEPGFFQTMNIPLLLGRTLLPGEKNAVVISESFARRQWPGQNPIGKQFDPRDPGSPRDTVVGVVGDARLNALNDDDAVEEYWSAQAGDMPAMSMVVKMSGAPEDFVSMTKAIADSLDPKIFPEIRPLKSLYQATVSTVERLAMVVSLIGVVAVLLAGVGIIGLVAYTVSQRTKEIAIRLALGAERAHVLAAVLRQFAWPMTIGLIAGVGVAAGASKVLRKVLFGVSNLDPASYVGAILVLAGIVGIAALLPARRALRLNLAKILHYE
ncbi:MAG TPA: ABC transporter permease [Edaphobacter sp.]|nr:ABC transporter permease [Edaphobacter sp.]